jgi:hypothetical protein
VVVVAHLEVVEDLVVVVTVLPEVVFEERSEEEAEVALHHTRDCLNGRIRNSET